jgi:hypothetical protein
VPARAPGSAETVPFTATPADEETRVAGLHAPPPALYSIVASVIDMSPSETLKRIVTYSPGPSTAGAPNSATGRSPRGPDGQPAMSSSAAPAAIPLNRFMACPPARLEARTTGPRQKLTDAPSPIASVSAVPP